MDEEDSALKLEVLTAALRADHGESKDLLEHLAKMLGGAYASGTTITRGGWFMSSNRPVQELTVRFDEWQFQIVREKHGTFTAREMKLVRGVALKTAEISMDECIERILREMMKLAEKNMQTRDALKKFVVG
ncbi:MAG TPA: hypothetical protein V6D17_10930 [Candidatus Obscuribacterales bacterium]